MGHCQVTLSLTDAHCDTDSLWQRHRPHILGNWSQLLLQLADRLNAPHPWKCYGTVWAATYNMLCPLMVPLQRQPDSTSPKTTWQYLSKDNLMVPLLSWKCYGTVWAATYSVLCPHKPRQLLKCHSCTVPLQRRPESTSPKTTWQYLFKDNLTVPLQRWPNSTSSKTTWQYLFKDNLTVPLQRWPNSTSSKTTWQYLFKDNLTVSLQRQLSHKQTQQQRQKANLSSLLIFGMPARISYYPHNGTAAWERRCPSGSCLRLFCGKVCSMYHSFYDPDGNKMTWLVCNN